MSLSDKGGADTFIPGSDMPLLLLTGPPSVTVQITSSPSMPATTSPMYAVVDQNPVTDDGVLGQPLVGGRHPVVGPFAVVDGDPDRFPVGPIGGPGGETPEPDLRTLQVGQHTDGAPGGIRGGAHPFVGGFVIRVVAVTEIQSGDVHSGLDQRQNQLVGLGCRAKGADDLSASTHV